MPSAVDSSVDSRRETERTEAASALPPPERGLDVTADGGEERQLPLAEARLAARSSGRRGRRSVRSPAFSGTPIQSSDGAPISSTSPSRTSASKTSRGGEER